MTREEAIKVLTNHKRFVFEDSEEDIAIDMAIRALKNEQTDGDLISRQAVIDSLYELCDTGESLKENPWRDNPHIDALVETIEQIPSAEKTTINPEKTTIKAE